MNRIELAVNAGQSLPPNEKLIGSVNPISLSVLDDATIQETIGERLFVVANTTIYEVRNSNPLRVYKKISGNLFVNGDEIRVGKIAAEIGVAPAFHRAFFAQDSVFMEMDHAGQTLDCHCEELAYNPMADPSTIQTCVVLNPKTMGERTTKKAGYFYTIEHLYGDRETFYYCLFSVIRKLALNHISYIDAHDGNIIPVCDGPEKALKLIDFGDAKLRESTKAAAFYSLKKLDLSWELYCGLPNLTPKTRELIQWFQDVQK